MGRHHKDVVDYFPHDCNSSNDSNTITILQQRFGNDGYAFWFKLLERLGRSEGHYIDISSDLKLELLCVKLHSTRKLGVEILNSLVEMQAIDKKLWENGIIWCQKFVDNISDVYKNRRRNTPRKPVFQGRNPLLGENNEISTDGNGLTTDNLQDNTDILHVEVQQRKGKGKEKERKKDVEENNDNNIFKQYENFIGTFDSHMAQVLLDAENTYTQEQINYAFQEAREKNARTWKFIQSILNRVHNQGILHPSKNGDRKEPNQSYEADYKW